MVAVPVLDSIAAGEHNFGLVLMIKLSQAAAVQIDLEAPVPPLGTSIQHDLQNAHFFCNTEKRQQVVPILHRKLLLLHAQSLFDNLRDSLDKHGAYKALLVLCRASRTTRSLGRSHEASPSPTESGLKAKMSVDALLYLLV